MFRVQKIKYTSWRNGKFLWWKHGNYWKPGFWKKKPRESKNTFEKSKNRIENAHIRQAASSGSFWRHPVCNMQGTKIGNNHSGIVCHEFLFMQILTSSLTPSCVCARSLPQPRLRASLQTACATPHRVLLPSVTTNAANYKKHGQVRQIWQRSS